MASLEDVIAVVDKWFADHVQKPPVSYQTETYNQMHAATVALKNDLAVAMTGQPLAPPSPPPGDDAGASGSDQAEEPETPPAGEDMGGDAGSSAKPTTTKPSKAG